MRNSVIRLLIAIGVVGIVWVGSYGLRAAMKTPEIIPPDRDISMLPMQLGRWQGRDVELDPKVFVNTDALKAVQREYRNDQGKRISIFLAVYDEPDKGVYHSPINCYRASGWQKIRDEYQELQSEGAPTIPVRLSGWERSGSRELVLYWYRLGEHTLFSRFQMGGVRLRMAGSATWPAMIKVLLQTVGGDSGSAESDLREFAADIHHWLEAKPEGQPETANVLAQPSNDQPASE